MLIARAFVQRIEAAVHRPYHLLPAARLVKVSARARQNVMVFPGAPQIERQRQRVANVDCLNIIERRRVRRVAELGLGVQVKQVVQFGGAYAFGVSARSSSARQSVLNVRGRLRHAA